MRESWKDRFWIEGTSFFGWKTREISFGKINFNWTIIKIKKKGFVVKLDILQFRICIKGVSLSFARLVSTLWFLAANIFPATFLEGRIICTVSRVHVNWSGQAKRFIARNKLFPVIVSYYKTLVPLFFPPYWKRRSQRPPVYLRVYGLFVLILFFLFLFSFSFFNPIYMM